MTGVEYYEPLDEEVQETWKHSRDGQIEGVPPPWLTKFLIRLGREMGAQGSLDYFFGIAMLGVRIGVEAERHSWDTDNRIYTPKYQVELEEWKRQ